MKHIYLFVSVILLLFGASAAALSIPEYSVSRSSFSPGEEGYFTITLENTESSDSDIEGVTVEISNPAEINSYTRYLVGDLEASAQTIVTVPFSIEDDAQDGVYTVQVRIFGFEQSATDDDTLNTKRASIPIYIVNEPNIEILTSKNTITELDTLPITLRNNGGAARKISLRLGGDFALFGTNQIYLSSLENESKLEIPIDARDAEDGAVSIPILLEYENQLGTKVNETKYLRITLKKDNLDLAITQESEIVIRKDSDISLQFRNNGDSKLDNVRISFESDDLRLKDLREISLGTLLPGDSKIARAVVFADLPPGLNQIPLIVKWVESDVEKEETITIPFTITSDADVNVFLDAKPSPLSIGSEHTLSVLVSNLGSYGIDTVDVRLESEALHLLDISDTRYIGSLEKDDFSTVQFKIRVAPTIPEGDYPVKITVDYKDRSGESKSREIIRNIHVYPPAGSSDGGPLPLILLLAIVGGAVWYFKFRKK